MGFEKGEAQVSWGGCMLWLFQAEIHRNIYIMQMQRERSHSLKLSIGNKTPWWKSMYGIIRQELSLYPDVKHLKKWEHKEEEREI